MDDKSLRLENGKSLPWFTKSVNNYLNKTTILYGKTNTGKSVIINEIMFLCKEYISLIFVICQSTIVVESSDYYGKVPPCSIKNSVTKEWLENFLIAQKGRQALFITANNIANLKSLFDKYKDNEASSMEILCINSAESYITQINSQSSMEFAKKKEKIDFINAIKNSKLKSLYKNTIRKHKAHINIKELSEIEACVVNYLDFNPNVMLIYDDCASAFKKWARDSELIREMFYNGRHYSITQIISAQDDKEIDSELRKNTSVCIFTTSQAASANFQRSSNYYSKDQKKEAEICINAIYGGSETNYKKLVYLQDPKISKPFCYTIASVYDNFTIGCEAFWEYGKMVSKNNKVIKNEFFGRYAIM